MLKLYKTTIIIFSEFDPSGMTLEDLAREADQGDALCESQKTQVTDINDKDLGNSEFFGVPGEDE